MGPKADQRGLQLLELSAEGAELTEYHVEAGIAAGTRDRANDARNQLARDRLAVRHTDDDPANSDCSAKSSNCRRGGPPRPLLMVGQYDWRDSSSAKRLKLPLKSLLRSQNKLHLPALCGVRTG